MNRNWKNWARVAVLLVPSLAFAQQPCTTGIRIDGMVTDPTGAVIPGAQVQTADGKETITDAVGHFLLSCVRTGSNRITAQAEGFTFGAATIEEQVGGSVHLNLQLEIAHVETVVQVDSDSGSTDRGAGTTTLNTKDVQLLADDPDDFIRQLQALSASGGGSPASTVILVDGFQNGSALPPKSSIASIRINPDLFSSEYQTPPFGGGIIEITTKPGADSFHGALFYADSDSSLNATDPFSATATPADKRRNGFELSGPVVSQKGGFALALEKRDHGNVRHIWALYLDINRFGIELLVYGFAFGVSALLFTQSQRQWDAMQKLSLERQLSKSQLKALQMQLEPHFLFNTMNALASLVAQGRNPEATKTLGHLNTILRTTLQRRAPEKVPFTEELRVIESYLAIQQVRFADRLEVKIEATAEALGGSYLAFFFSPLLRMLFSTGLLPWKGAA